MRVCCCALLAVVFMWSGPALTEDRPKEGVKPDAPKISGWQRLFRKHAAEYKVVIDGDDKSEVKLLADPVLQWSQPVRGGADGAVFLWTQSGRPVAIGTFFIWPIAEDKQGVAHELHSLAQLPMTATWRERKWTPPKDSVVWTPVAEAPAPAKTAEQRLRQMRELAGQFHAESLDKNDRKWELRLLPRPIYRYDLSGAKTQTAENQKALDGALFGLVEGTDLEIVLLIEARPTAQGPQWHYALARMSDFRLKVSHAKKVVWEVGGEGYDNPRQAYYCTTVESRKSPEDE